jgi:hypothetical protein
MDQQGHVSFVYQVCSLCKWSLYTCPLYASLDSSLLDHRISFWTISYSLPSYPFCCLTLYLYSFAPLSSVTISLPISSRIILLEGGIINALTALAQFDSNGIFTIKIITIKVSQLVNSIFQASRHSCPTPDHATDESQIALAAANLPKIKKNLTTQMATLRPPMRLPETFMTNSYTLNQLIMPSYIDNLFINHAPKENSKFQIMIIWIGHMQLYNHLSSTSVFQFLIMYTNFLAPSPVILILSQFSKDMYSTRTSYI